MFCALFANCCLLSFLLRGALASTCPWKPTFLVGMPWFLQFTICFHSNPSRPDSIVRSIETKFKKLQNCLTPLFTHFEDDLLYNESKENQTSPHGPIQSSLLMQQIKYNKINQPQRSKTIPSTPAAATMTPVPPCNHSLTTPVQPSVPPCARKRKGPGKISHHPFPFSHLLLCSHAEGGAFFFG